MKFKRYIWEDVSIYKSYNDTLYGCIMRGDYDLATLNATLYWNRTYLHGK